MGIVYYNKKKCMNLFKMTKVHMEIKTFSQKINKLYKMQRKRLELSMDFLYNVESVGQSHRITNNSRRN